uniref:Uncharacterized protein n=1 Tax=Human betaherpesvirus 6 TaxID=10368 RepID=A0A5P9U7K4_9BETA|nr:hypothetical protein [Human betaherpesvirus 6]
MHQYFGCKCQRTELGCKRRYSKYAICYMLKTMFFSCFLSWDI